VEKRSCFMYMRPRGTRTENLPDPEGSPSGVAGSTGTCLENQGNGVYGRMMTWWWLLARRSLQVSSLVLVET